jgi:hypothetical protein
MPIALRLWRQTRGVAAAPTIGNEKDSKVAAAELVEDDEVLRVR